MRLDRSISHPFERWPRRFRREGTWLLVFAAVLPLVAGALLEPLHEGEPGGKSIIDFELAGTFERTEMILETWRNAGVLGVAKNIQIFDFIYPIIYGAALGACCVGTSRLWRGAGRPRLASTGIVFAWVAFVAAGFDYIENIGLSIALWHRPTSPWPEIAYLCATLKFTGTILALLYALTAMRFVRKDLRSSVVRKIGGVRR